MLHVGMIDESMTYQRRELVRLYEAAPEQPILLIITSSGGSALGLLALADTISHLRSGGAKIDCLVEGYACSAALLLVQACETRIMGSNALLMVHGLAYESEGDLGDHRASYRLGEIVTERMARLLSRRTKRDAEHWAAHLDGDRPLWLDAEEALDVGLVDRVTEDVV
ncbi:MAG: ATP-dependent Clp protease proteolytic subunit [Chloroflexi bacterium]|nr:ATP-dependent Clp protease proteolytic subunit [Chloroflexota bacterium]